MGWVYIQYSIFNPHFPGARIEVVWNPYWYRFKRYVHKALTSGIITVAWTPGIILMWYRNKLSVCKTIGLCRLSARSDIGSAESQALGPTRSATKPAPVLLQLRYTSRCVQIPLMGVWYRHHTRTLHLSENHHSAYKYAAVLDFLQTHALLSVCVSTWHSRCSASPVCTLPIATLYYLPPSLSLIPLRLHMTFLASFWP